MATTADIAKRYFAALSAHDLDAALACWAPGAIDRIVGGRDLIAPDGIREYFGSLFEAFPDFKLEVVELTTYRGRTAVRWRARGTFAGPGRFMDFVPNGARINIQGCDVVTVQDDLISHNDAYIDSGDIARQLGLLPPAGSPAEARLTRLANVRTRAREMIHGAEPEPIAEGVWVVRGGFPIKTMNVYLIEDGDGVTVFDAGIEAMGTRVAGGLRTLRRRHPGRPRARRLRPPRGRALHRRSHLLPSRRTGRRGRRDPLPRLLGPGQARPPWPRPARTPAPDLGRRRGQGGRHGQRGR